jgi:hypothetical protein
MQRGFITIFFLGIIVICLGIMSLVYLLSQNLVSSSQVPPPTPIPTGCYYQKVTCVKAPCDPILVCPAVQSDQLNSLKDWQVYRDDKVGFLFKYPADWDNASPQGDARVLVMSKHVESPLALGNDGLWIDLLETDSQGKQSKGTVQIEKELQDELVSGTEQSYHYKYSLMTSEHVYILYCFSLKKETLLANEKICDQIAGSFKLIE